MAQPSAPPLQDKNAPFSHQGQPVNASPYTPVYPEPPPPYAAQDPGKAAGFAPSPQVPAPYPTQAAVPLMHAPPVQQIVVPPPQQIVVPPAQPASVIVVGGANLPPGTCTVCRKGKMKDSASFWTWLCCCLLLPVGILPGLCVFCCCCREPKCTNCGFTP